MSDDPRESPRGDGRPPMTPKKVDESWKEQVERERKVAAAQPAKPGPNRVEAPVVAPPSPTPAEPARRPSPPPPPEPESEPVVEEAGLPEPNFAMFLSSLSMQAMMALGELPIPGTNQRREDLEQARYLIDTLGLLQQKTQGNLTPEESQFLDNALYELRLRYTQRLQASIPPPPGEPRR